MTQDPVGLEGVRYQERYLEVEPGVELLLRSWEPLAPALDWPVVVVPGWISQPQGWAGLLQGLAARQPVYYLETREKVSARFGRRIGVADMTIQRNVLDLLAVSEMLPGEPGARVWLAASLGSTILVSALATGKLACRAAMLVSPNTQFSYPWWVDPLTYAPNWVYPPVRAFVLWYMRRFKVDAEAEPEQMARYERTMHAADPGRLKISARAFGGYAVWDLLPAIEVPVGVAWASSDTLHGEDDVRRMLGLLGTGVAFPCPSNLYLHSAALLSELDRLLAG